MEAKAHIKHIKISPKKLRFVVDELKRLRPRQALDYLGVSQTRTSKVLYRAIKSAIDNGVQNHGMNDKLMKFGALQIDEGKALRRFRAGARGTGKPYYRSAAHVTVTVVQDDQKRKQTEKKTKLKKDAEVASKVKNDVADIKKSVKKK